MSDGATPDDKLRGLIEEWRENPSTYNPEYVTDQMEYSVQKRLAGELEKLVEESSSPVDPSLLRFTENLVLMGYALNDAMYAANRYQNIGFEHQRETALEHVEELRDLADELLVKERKMNGDESESEI